MQFRTFTPQDTAGNYQPTATATVYEEGTQTLATIYDADDQAISNPVSANADGQISFAAANGVYDIQFNLTNPSSTQTLESERFYDAAEAIADVEAAAAAAAGHADDAAASAVTAAGHADDAAASAVTAAGHADDAAASAATAESAAGPNYANTTAGLAATSNGEAFAVDNGDDTVTVYLNDGGSAVAQRTLATTAALAASGGAALVGTSSAGTVEQALGLGTVAELIADTSAARGEGAIWRAGGFSYSEAASDASDEHLTTAGSVKLYIATPDPISAEALGAVGNGTTDDTLALQAALDIGESTRRPVIFQSQSYRTTATLSVKCPVLITPDATITKDLDASGDGTPVLRIFGTLHSEGSFRKHVGKLTVEQSSIPPADGAANGRTESDGIQFSGVVHADFGQLFAENVAYAYRTYDNPTLGYEARLWGNNFPFLYARACRQGFLRIGFGGSGANTENNFGACYFNGKEFDSPTLVPMEAEPLYFDNAEGMAFGTLNMEWCSLVTSLVTRFIQVQNGSNISIQHFHPEGLKMTDAVTASLINVSNFADQGNVLIETLHINNWEVTAGNFDLVSGAASSVGKVHIEAISGKSNDFTGTNLRILNSNSGSEVAVTFGASSGISDVLGADLDATRRGTPPANLYPTVWFGGDSYQRDHSAAISSNAVNIGQGSYLRITGGTGPLQTINYATRFPFERSRQVMIKNDSGGSIALNTSGNMRLPNGVSSPFSWGDNRHISAVIDLVENKIEITGASG